MARPSQTNLGTLHGPHRLPVRLSRFLHARRDGREAGASSKSTAATQPVDAQVHLREGSPLWRARVRRGPSSLSGGPQGAKGSGTFVRVTWNEALDCIAQRMIAIRDTRRRRRHSPILLWRIERPVHAGHDRCAVVPRRSVRRASRERSAPRRPAQPTGRSTARCRGSRTRTTSTPRLIVLWGVNPSASGIHIVPFIKEARSRGAKLVVIDPRATSLARQADLHLAPRPGTDLPLALSLHKYLFDRGLAAAAFLDEHARGVERPSCPGRRMVHRARCGENVRNRRRRRWSALLRSTPSSSPAVDPMRVGTRAQPERRQRRCGGHGAARGRQASSASAAAASR